MNNFSNCLTSDLMAKQDYSPVTKDSKRSVSFFIGLIVLLILLGLFGIVYLIDGILPTPLLLEDEKAYPEAFIAERAQHDLKILTDLGPRVTGTYENEVLAANFLIERIISIIQNADSNHKIEVDLQSPMNIQNIVVKLHSLNNTNSSLLVNAHFDSSPNSPGASDDGINCVVMLEILRKLSKSPERPLHDIIFLFNGAEEPGLQASRLFVAEHKWAKEAKVVINLEAAGHGGKLILFQTGPNAPWLSKYYNQVPHPHGQVAGEEIFQSKLIPSGTDFVVFKNMGKMIGLDMAFYKNGYRYHTKFDDFEHIPKGSYQHAGDNTLSLVKSLANAPELSNGGSEDSKIVYFDFFGLFMISYTQLVGNIINYVVVISSVVLFLIGLYYFELEHKQKALYLAFIFGALLGGWILAGLFVAIVAFVLDSVGYSMSWYGNPWMIFGLFCAPTAAITPLLSSLIKKDDITSSVKSQIQAHAVRLLWTLILFIGSLLNIRSTYAILIPIMFNVLGFIIIYIFRIQHSVRKWQIVYVISNLIPVPFSMYVSLLTMCFLVPVTGRFGSHLNVDLMIGMISFAFTLLIISPFMALANLMSNFKYYLAVLSSIFLLFFIIVFTPLGFPYSGNPDSPAPKRLEILNTRQISYLENGTEISEDARYFLSNDDRNSPLILKSFVKELNDPKSEKETCGNSPYCKFSYSTWIPAGQSEPIYNLKVLSKAEMLPKLLRYVIAIQNPDIVGIIFSPKLGLQIRNISLISGGATSSVIESPMQTDSVDDFTSQNKRFGIFTSIDTSFGNSSSQYEALIFSCDVQVPENFSGATMKLTLSGNRHQLENVEKIVPQPRFTKFLNQFPDWAVVIAYIESEESYWI